MGIRTFARVPARLERKCLNENEDEMKKLNGMLMDYSSLRAPRRIYAQLPIDTPIKK
jgi:hypothetical protein